MENIKKTKIRFPNEDYYVEIELDLDKFTPVQEFDDVIFGWYGDVYIEVKK